MGRHAALKGGGVDGFILPCGAGEKEKAAWLFGGGMGVEW